MGLTYRFTFTAPATTTAAELETFLNSVESDAQAMGFKPTQLFQATFDTKERRDFARRIRTMYRLTDDRLKGVVIPAENQVWRHDANFGDCWILPETAVVLLVTNEQQMETVFAFALYPETLNDMNGRPLLNIPVGARWYFTDFVQTPDPRYRKIVNRFGCPLMPQPTQSTRTSAVRATVVTYITSRKGCYRNVRLLGSSLFLTRSCSWGITALSISKSGMRCHHSWHFKSPNTLEQRAALWICLLAQVGLHLDLLGRGGNRFWPTTFQRHSFKPTVRTSEEK